MSETITQTDAEAPALPVADPAPEPIAAPAATEPVSETRADPVIPPEPELATPEPVAEAAPVAETPASPVYQDFTLPEGLTAAPEVLTRAKEVFGELGLPQESAQRLVDLHAEVSQQAVAGAFSSATDYWNGKAREWEAEVRADPDIGGNRVDTSLSQARAALADGLSEKQRDRLWADLTDTKMGSHPVLVRQFAEYGKRMQQIYDATGTTTWAAAMKKLKEPAAQPPGNPARAPGANGRPADRRYGGSR